MAAGPAHSGPRKLRFRETSHSGIPASWGSGDGDGDRTPGPRDWVPKAPRILGSGKCPFSGPPKVGFGRVRKRALFRPDRMGCLGGVNGPPQSGGLAASLGPWFGGSWTGPETGPWDRFRDPGSRPQGPVPGTGSYPPIPGDGGVGTGPGNRPLGPGNRLPEPVPGTGSRTGPVPPKPGLGEGRNRPSPNPGLGRPNRTPGPGRETRSLGIRGISRMSRPPKVHFTGYPRKMHFLAFSRVWDVPNRVWEPTPGMPVRTGPWGPSGRVPGKLPPPLPIPDRSGPVRSGPVRSGPVRSGPVRSGPVRSGMG
jgi:hypothetical protein